jgi:hypothetical protein
MKRSKVYVNYNEDSQENPTVEHPIITINDIPSTSYWISDTTKALKIEVKNQENIFGDTDENILQRDASFLIFSEWKDENWLKNVDIKSLECNDNTKTLIEKLRIVYLAVNTVGEMYIDGFMDSLLHLLRFDSYPCLIYPQYQYSTMIGSREHNVIAKSDFSIVSASQQILLLVVEDKTVKSATYANNWKEDQVLGELFVAVHSIVNKKPPVKDLKYPILVHAVRVIGTQFTFYKAEATKEYIKESAKTLPQKNKLIVYRHPIVEEDPDPSRLIAYDICNLDDRKNILKYLCYIRRFIAS